MKWRATSILRLLTPAACSDEEEAWEAFLKTENFNLNLPKRPMAIGCQLCLFSFIVLPHSLRKMLHNFLPSSVKVECCSIPLIPHFNLRLPHNYNCSSLTFKIYCADVFGKKKYTLSLLRLKLNNINLKPTLWFQGQVSLKSLFKIITWQNWASLK